jgi:uncharacterized membrane protein YfcA
LESILPAGLGEWAALGLVALSFLTSLITATFSLGGGSLMIIAMTLVMPPVVVVPARLRPARQQRGSGLHHCAITSSGSHPVGDAGRRSSVIGGRSPT